jgi:hypothetical protein
MDSRQKAACPACHPCLVLEKGCYHSLVRNASQRPHHSLALSVSGISYTFYHPYDGWHAAGILLVQSTESHRPPIPRIYPWMLIGSLPRRNLVASDWAATTTSLKFKIQIRSTAALNGVDAWKDGPQLARSWPAEGRRCRLQECARRHRRGVESPRDTITVHHHHERARNPVARSRQQRQNEQEQAPPARPPTQNTLAHPRDPHLTPA